MSSHRITRVVTTLVVALLAAACRESTSPRHATSPAIGTFDFTAKLDSLTYFTFVDGQSVYHHATIPATAAALSGILTIEDSVLVLSPVAARLPTYEATLLERPCRDPSTGPCDTPAPSYTWSYTSGSAFSISNDTLDAPAHLYGSGEAVTLVGGRVYPDSIVGRLAWYTKLGPAGSAYDGTFVARRRQP